MKNFLDKGQDKQDRKRQDKQDSFCCFYPAYPASEGDPSAKRILFSFSNNLSEVPVSV